MQIALPKVASNQLIQLDVSVPGEDPVKMTFSADYSEAEVADGAGVVAHTIGTDLSVLATVVLAEAAQESDEDVEDAEDESESPEEPAEPEVSAEA